MNTLSSALCIALVLTVACGDDTNTGGSPSGGGGSSSDGGGTEGGAPATGGGGSTPDGGGGSGTGGSADCSAIPPGPFEPTVATNQLDGSEDFTFDGTGGIVGKDG